ncbi:hypothetical protein M5K25_015075 [Dendrobium thyrsiflorum]|uniref:Uncharacterized protein n=1 Tax=Dendrobium thyrsiflorum TaxID=117978 RepID=A0ABD0UPA5_DENTH
MDYSEDLMLPFGKNLRSGAQKNSYRIDASETKKEGRRVVSSRDREDARLKDVKKNETNGEFFTRPSELSFQQTYSRIERLGNTNPTTPNSTQSEPNFQTRRAYSRIERLDEKNLTSPKTLNSDISPSFPHKRTLSKKRRSEEEKEETPPRPPPESAGPPTDVGISPDHRPTPEFCRTTT